jgi:hypothetical protein
LLEDGGSQYFDRNCLTMLHPQSINFDMCGGSLFRDALKLHDLRKELQRQRLVSSGRSHPGVMTLQNRRAHCNVP